MPSPPPDPFASLRDEGAGLLVLIRHGRTRWNVEGRFLGRTDVPLDATGRTQAAALSTAIGGVFHAVFCSPSSRAAATAAAIAPPSPVPDPGLFEMDQGELEGLTAPEAIARWPAFFAAWATDPTGARIPGGESLPEVRDRTMAVLERVRRDHPGQVTAVVGHQLSIASAVAALSGEPLGAWRRFRLEHTEAFVLRARPDRWEVAGRFAPCEIGG